MGDSSGVHIEGNIIISCDAGIRLGYGEQIAAVRYLRWYLGSLVGALSLASQGLYEGPSHHSGPRNRRADTYTGCTESSLAMHDIRTGGKALGRPRTTQGSVY